MSSAPLFLVMSSRKCWYSAGSARSYDFVRKRSAKDSPERLSTVFQSLPSVEPCRVQSLGSRSAKSLAEVSAYVTSLIGLSRSNSAHPGAPFRPPRRGSRGLEPVGRGSARLEGGGELPVGFGRRVGQGDRRAL